MERILKTISLAPSPYCLEGGFPNYIITITETEILYAQDPKSSRWSLATILLLKVDTPFRDDEITHPLMPNNVEEVDAYIREVKYRMAKNERICALEMLLEKEIAEKDELATELELFKNMKYELYRVLDSV
jgi:hypothetical protein